MIYSGLKIPKIYTTYTTYTTYNPKSGMGIPHIPCFAHEPWHILSEGRCSADIIRDGPILCHGSSHILTGTFPESKALVRPIPIIMIIC